MVMYDAGPQRLARSLIYAGEVAISDIWLRYWAAGGSADVMTLDTRIHGLTTLPLVHRVPLMEALEELSVP